jgi:hypothetical protein
MFSQPKVRLIRLFVAFVLTALLAVTMLTPEQTAYAIRTMRFTTPTTAGPIMGPRSEKNGFCVTEPIPSAR